MCYVYGKVTMAFFFLAPFPYYGLEDRSICWSDATDPLGLLCALSPAPAPWKGELVGHDGADGRVVGWMGGTGKGNEEIPVT